MSKYISLDNLARYDGKMQEYAESVCAEHNDAMWRQTEKAGAVSFWPVGNSPLEGTVEFIFKETGPASGTKSPDNPSTISGVSSIGLTVCQEAGVDEHEYTINLGNTYYGGSVDLATGVLTETLFHGVFDDPYGYIETLTDSTYVCIQQTKGSYPPHATNADVNISCNMFATAGAGEKIALRGGAGGGAVALFLLRSRLDLSNAADPSNPTSAEWVAAFQAWRQQQSQEIEFTYTRNTPLTVQLTAPQLRSLIQPDKYVPRINTVYTDAEAVQIAYQKNPVRDEFEKVQAILAQGGNI